MRSGGKPQKCNQGKYVFSQAGDLRRPLIKHSGEKSNKCNQCDYASFQAGNFKGHLKMHGGKKKLESMWLYILTGMHFEKTFSKEQARKTHKSPGTLGLKKLRSVHIVLQFSSRLSCILAFNFKRNLCKSTQTLSLTQMWLLGSTILTRTTSPSFSLVERKKGLWSCSRQHISTWSHWIILSSYGTCGHHPLSATWSTHFGYPQAQL